jgi:hypothetical protein
MTYTEHYLTNLLKKLEQPHLVFDNKLFIIPTSSPMFELLPGQVCRHIEFKIPGKENFENYTFLILDLNTYKIDPVKDTYEYIKENEDKI